MDRLQGDDSDDESESSSESSSDDQDVKKGKKLKARRKRPRVEIEYEQEVDQPSTSKMRAKTWYMYRTQNRKSELFITMCQFNNWVFKNKISNLDFTDIKYWYMYIVIQTIYW